MSEGIMDCGGNRVVGVCRGGDKRQVRGWDTAYQMTGLPTAGDDLSKKPLISAQAGPSLSDKSLLLSVAASNTCSFRLQSGRRTTADKLILALTAVRPL